MWSKARALWARLFCYSACITKPGEAGARFSSVEEMTECATAHMQWPSWSFTLTCVNALKENSIEELDIEHAASRP